MSQCAKNTKENRLGPKVHNRLSRTSPVIFIIGTGKVGWGQNHEIRLKTRQENSGRTKSGPRNPKTLETMHTKSWMKCHTVTKLTSKNEVNKTRVKLIRAGQTQQKTTEGERERHKR